MSESWSASGAMALTGRPDGPPLVAPAGVVERIHGLGRSLDLDVLPLLGERAATAGLTRRGDVSCGGASRLLAAADGWVAVSLAREDDVALVPAWLEQPDVAADPWPAVAAAIARRPAATVVERAALLGLPAAAVPTAQGKEVEPGPAGPLPVRATPVGDGGRSRDEPLVVDLSSLWAGPLCGRLLAERGARVIKVESTSRPDGARAGPAAFFALLHQGKEAVALDFRDPTDVGRLRRLLAVADVVIDSSRPRALAQLGIDAVDVVATGPAVWVSITGHGRDGAASGRIAFGDDGAAAGGLVAWDAGGPCFVADAVADPLTGVTAAAAAVAVLDRGGRWLVDVALSSVAAHVARGGAGASWIPGGAWDVAPPVAPAPTGRAPALGEHTESVLRELGCA